MCIDRLHYHNIIHFIPIKLVKISNIQLKYLYISSRVSLAGLVLPDISENARYGWSDGTRAYQGLYVYQGTILNLIKLFFPDGLTGPNLPMYGLIIYQTFFQHTWS